MDEPRITSTQNERIKNAAKLRQRRQRDSQRRMLIDGAREILRAREAGIEIPEAFVCQTFSSHAAAQEALSSLESAGTDIAEVTEAVFEKLAYGERREGLVAVGRMPERSLTDLPQSETALLAIVDGVEKPGNLGAILRSADAAGVSAVVVTGEGTDLWNPNTIRASLGTVFSMPVCHAPRDETIRWLREEAFQVFTARVDAETLYTDVDWSGRVGIVLGSEAEGLSDAWSGERLTPAPTPIKLPMLGATDSLNVSATASVLFFEALRQRGGSI